MYSWRGVLHHYDRLQRDSGIAWRVRGEPLVAWVSDAVYPVAMPTFLVIAALHERRRRASARDAIFRIITLLALGLTFFYIVPPATERLALQFNAFAISTTPGQARQQVLDKLNISVETNRDRPIHINVTTTAVGSRESPPTRKEQLFVCVICQSGTILFCFQHS